MNRLTDNFEVDIDRAESDFVSRLDVEATFNSDCTYLSIDKIVDKDNSFRVLSESELTLQEIQQLMSSVTRQVLNRYSLYVGSL